MLKTLNTLSRLRHFSVDEFRQALAGCLGAETAATEAHRAAETAIARERAAASLDAGDGAVEAFAAWLPIGRQALHVAREMSARAEANTALARARLAAALAAAEVVDQMRATRIAGLQAEANRREQAILDEIGLRSK